MRIGFLIFVVGVQSAFAGQRCAACHPSEAAGFAKTAMAHSLSGMGAQPEGTFHDPVSGTTFETRTGPGGVWQTLRRPSESQTVRLQYIIGSGAHAYGFLAQIGNHLFQSPIAYYTKRRAWGMAPGYAGDPHPDFSRPVTMECLDCHSDRPRPIANTMNRYRNPPVGIEGISCDRCHGDATRHLKKPVPGSIINPAELPIAARNSICEQCHLIGEVRVPNPGRQISDFRPGEPLEDVYSIYVVRGPPQASIKVISQAEELDMSMCFRKSTGRLWCGTCHNPHRTPAHPVEYFRKKCLSCHAATLAPAHAARRNCIGCHMPRRPAVNGTHTAFTDHRILRYPKVTGGSAQPETLTAWRQPPPAFRKRNLALALVWNGMDKSNSKQVIRGFRMLVAMESSLSNDAPALTTLGTVLLKGKEPGAAQSRFARALQLRPKFAPYEVNLAVTLAENGHRGEAIRHLERALQLDPLLQRAVELLSHLYRLQSEPEKAEAVLASYRAAMGITVEASKQHPER